MLECYYSSEIPLQNFRKRNFRTLKIPKAEFPNISEHWRLLSLFRMLCHNLNRGSMRHSEGRKWQAPAVLTLALGTVFGTVLTKIPISVWYFGTVFELTFLVMCMVKI